MAEWPTLLVTTWFVAEPSLVDDAHQLYTARVGAIPPEAAEVRFISASPVPAEDPHLLTMLRETASYEGLDPARLELFTLRCVLALDPAREDEVCQQLFFCGPAERDPFPGSQSHEILRPLRD
ncbi:hypothetical protein EAH68_14135 [Corynebacterium hylobatis]|uniref:Uncharacterized protein n=1 Tax=Corynebacterium hylobatis TaxID=1859290 RepID=A0A3S0B2R6_9CORY|nr:hypothetical protein [Corynebacterium hylobatis]RSZ61283.1 hypothetical protein EAH68_14135 [Corynebacterium hylobatis]